MAKHRGRDVLFDDVLGFYHGGVLRLQGGELEYIPPDFPTPRLSNLRTAKPR